MKNTPITDYVNPELLAMIPAGSSRVIEVGCSGGVMAREFRRLNPGCEYVGIEVDPQYADASRRYCSKVVIGDIERMEESVFESLFPSDCWVFGDVLEHLYDPWSVLRRIRERLSGENSVVACIPNAQHWSIQARLNLGIFRYEELGLLDRTHIRWFTKTTIQELFRDTGYKIVEGDARVFDEPDRKAAMVGIRALAQALRADPDLAENDATAFQWVVRAIPA